MNHILDVTKLLCPMPVIKLSQMIADIAEEDIVEVLATDPGVKQDIPAWCRVHGHEVLSIEEDSEKFILTIKKY
ncbi:MAG: sulfurtransferase TusA family protein [Gammaproteobacteria bacterium]|jgi:tRNA 2-thiouridine synthesizing protein A|nr:sulfurtransferase TusA family protein [Gammaproteobacteria bacterium]|tara:strand:- start:207 stop:428 length:222 start_codon:yes stop_codon:yes gene_type:complete